MIFLTNIKYLRVLLVQKDYYIGIKILECSKVIKNYAKLSLSWKKGFDSGIVIPKNAIQSTEYREVFISNRCDKKISHIKKRTKSDWIRKQPCKLSWSYATMGC